MRERGPGLGGEVGPAAAGWIPPWRVRVKGDWRGFGGV